MVEVQQWGVGWCGPGGPEWNKPTALQCITPAGGLCWGDSVPVTWKGGPRSGTVDICVYCQVNPKTRPIVVAALSDISNTGASEVELPGRPPLSIPTEQRRGSYPCWLSVRSGSQTAECANFSVTERCKFNLEVSPIKIYLSSREAVVWWNTSRLPFIPAISVKLYDAETDLLVARCSQANTGSAVLKLPDYAPLNRNYRVTVTSLKLAHAVRDQFHGANDNVVVTDERAPRRPSSGWQENYVTRPSDVVGRKRVYGRANAQFVKGAVAAQGKGKGRKSRESECYPSEEGVLVGIDPGQPVVKQGYEIDHAELARLIVAAQGANPQQKSSAVASEELMAQIKRLALESGEVRAQGRAARRKEGSRSPSSPTGVFDFEQASPRSSGSDSSTAASPSSEPPQRAKQAKPAALAKAAQPRALVKSKQPVACVKSKQPDQRAKQVEPAPRLKSKQAPNAHQRKDRAKSKEAAPGVQSQPVGDEHDVVREPRPQEGKVARGFNPWAPEDALLGPSCLPPIISAPHWKAKRETPSLTARLRTAIEGGNVVDFSDYGLKYGEMCPNTIDHDRPVAILL